MAEVISGVLGSLRWVFLVNFSRLAVSAVAKMMNSVSDETFFNTKNGLDGVLGWHNISKILAYALFKSGWILSSISVQYIEHQLDLLIQTFSKDDTGNDRSS